MLTAIRNYIEKKRIERAMRQLDAHLVDIFRAAEDKYGELGSVPIKLAIMRFLHPAS